MGENGSPRPSASTPHAREMACRGATPHACAMALHGAARGTDSLPAACVPTARLDEARWTDPLPSACSPTARLGEACWKDPFLTACVPAARVEEARRIDKGASPNRDGHSQDVVENENGRSRDVAGENQNPRPSASKPHARAMACRGATPHARAMALRGAARGSDSLPAACVPTARLDEARWTDPLPSACSPTARLGEAC